MLIEYLPNFVSTIEEFKIMISICEDYALTLERDIEYVLKDLFINDATETGVAHYERILNIIPKLTDDLNIRKANILCEYNQILPFTLENLEKILNSICGENGYKIRLSYEKFILNIKLSLSVKYLEDNVFKLLERIVPVNMLLKLDLDYNRWEEVKRFNWGYIKNVDWIGLKESEDIKNG